MKGENVTVRFFIWISITIIILITFTLVVGCCYYKLSLRQTNNGVKMEQYPPNILKDKHNNDDINKGNKD